MSAIEFIQKNQNRNLVLFIHGFTGSNETWINDLGQEFPRMLLEDRQIADNYDFAYISYYTTLVDMYGFKVKTSFFKRMFNHETEIARKNLGINQLGDFIQSVIKFNCDYYENIIIIAHSMGGLVTKSFILNELNKDVPSNKVKLFISLAVPHNGTEWGKLGEKLFNNVQAIDLKPLSPVLSKINQNWIHCKSLPQTICFYGQYDEIVDEGSAILFQAEKPETVPCDDNHNTITRPKDKRRHVYVAIQSILRKFAEEISLGEPFQVRPFVDQGELDDEIFVLRLLIADVHNIHINSAKQTFFNAEYMRKVLVNQGEHAIATLADLYSRIETFYSIAFGKLMSGDLNDSNHLVTFVHEQLSKETDFLKSTIPLLGGFQKMGMLHQLMNMMEKDLWWAQKQNIQSIEQFRKARGI
ncbi:ABC-three component system protein [Paenibacillus polysaccharolyticus]|uniref:ABC-three component system protein n=1 Tax=Paenibacillus polysaccharolyticus TaxID=582692 RepID=UPI00280B2849|nr:ABC-three component system protein [Paenibacillus polysaccharolyticus]